MALWHRLRDDSGELLSQGPGSPPRANPCEKAEIWHCSRPLGSTGLWIHTLSREDTTIGWFEHLDLRAVWRPPLQSRMGKFSPAELYHETRATPRLQLRGVRTPSQSTRFSESAGWQITNKGDRDRFQSFLQYYEAAVLSVNLAKAPDP